MAPHLCSPAQEILIFTESRVLGKTKIAWEGFSVFISPSVVWLSCLLQALLRAIEENQLCLSQADGHSSAGDFHTPQGSSTNLLILRAAPAPQSLNT